MAGIVDERTAEQRLRDRGVSLHVQEFPDTVDTAVIGAMTIDPLRGQVWVAVRTSTSAEQRERVWAWALASLDRFAEHGPGPDDWRELPDGAFQKWAREVYLPDMGFLTD